MSAVGASISLETIEPLNLPIRRVSIRQPLRNIVENARRYGKGAGVSVEKSGNAAKITITDKGPGIEWHDLERVFDPYESMEGSRSRETGGTGLGLPIARAILRAHGGDVRLENANGKGLAAIVSLPLA